MNKFTRALPRLEKQLITMKKQVKELEKIKADKNDNRHSEAGVFIYRLNEAITKTQRNIELVRMQI